MSLSREIRQVLAEMELLSHGAITAYNSSGRGGGERLLPPGESMPPHLMWGERFARCAVEKLPGLLEEARTDLAAFKRRQRQVDASVTLIDLILAEGEGWPPEDVGRRFGVAPAYVCRIRANHGRDVETGRASSSHAVELSPDERRDRALVLADQGMTGRQIAQLLKVSQETVRKYLKAA